MPKSRFSAVLYLLLVFVSGALVGGFSTRFMTSAPVKAAPRSLEDWRKRYVNEMRDRVKLDEAQVKQLQTVLDDTKLLFDQVRSRYKPSRDQERAAVLAIHNQQVEKVRALLRDDQRPVYEKFREERERRRQQLQAEKEKEKKDR
jgi:hypothetical protein